MGTLWKEFLLIFIPLFVALNTIGVIPFFIYHTQNTNKKQLKKVVLQSTFVAFVIGIGFVLLGEYILKFLGVTFPDFKIAGGALLLIFSVQAVMKEEGKISKFEGDFSVVPLAIPLMIGPAVLTTLLVFKGLYSIWMIAFALAVNLVVSAFMFWYSNTLTKILGKAGMKAVGKIASILLAAIAVMLMRNGIMEGMFPK